MSKLFSPLTIKEVTIPNRIMMSPMCMYQAKEDGKVLDWHKVHYGTRSVAKVGLNMLEATGVEPRGRITDQDLGIWEDSQIEGLKEIVDFGHQQGSVMAIQLAHAGRKAEVSDQSAIIAPSPIPFSQGKTTPKEMSVEIIKEVVHAFAVAAKRADQAGFDIIELHGAHGYLIHQFLSPISNQREDEYGGTREGRVRFLKEIVDEVKKNWPNNKPIFLRVSATDYHPDGINLEEMIEILKIVKSWEGIDVIDVSSGGTVPVVPPFAPGYQVKFAEEIKKQVGIPTVTVGLITEPEMAEEIVWNERADLVALGRELLRNPYWTLQAANKLKVDLSWPTPYARGKK